MRTPILVVLAVLFSTPLAPALPPAQDDAGSGRDAPDAPDPAFLVAANVVHEGLLTGPFLDQQDFYAFEGRAGDVVAIRVRGPTACFSLLGPDLVERGTTGCSYSEAYAFSNVPTYELDVDGTWFVDVRSLHAAEYRFTIAIGTEPRDVSALGPVVGVAPLVPGADPTCGTGAPVTATGGEGPDGLVYAALKTGFRAVVAWQTPEPVAATLTASVDGGAAEAFEEPFARTQHVFVLDRLPEGRSLCFTPEGGAARALRLANAMHAHDGDAYVVNLLVLADEQPSRTEVEEALDRFAVSLWDATDGHVRAGRVVTLFGDYERHNSGWASCTGTSAASPDPRPLCHQVHDVIFTYDGSTTGAAATYLDAIRHPLRAIWMDQELQAGAVGLADDTGRVLTHEMGHYLFGAMDLYGDVTGAVPDCWNATLGLSVMGARREATELDDEVNRCPNEATIADYVPSWTLLREDFPLVPDRAGVIDAGPAGDGGAYARRSVVMVPQVGDATKVQDDAGSGRDAPAYLEPDAPLVEPGRVYDAQGVPDAALNEVGDRDAFRFEGAAGRTVELLAEDFTGCYYLQDAEGRTLDLACTRQHDGLQEGPARAVLPATGTYYVFVRSSVTPAAYRFGFGLDAPAPDLGGPLEA